jgi:thioredoxin 2
MAEDTLLAKCPSCGVKNRIPIDRAGQPGRCGRCQTQLPPNAFYAEHPISVSEAKFDAVTRMSPLPVLVDFGATWCAPCRQMEPVLEELARELAGRLLVLKVDSEQSPMVAARFAVQAIPTLVILRSGLEVDRMTGALPLPTLRQKVQRFL